MAMNNKKKELMVEDTSGQSKWTKTRDVAVPVPGDMPGRQTGAVTTAVSAGGTANQGYKPSDAVTHAQDLLKQQMAQKPGAYQSQWQTQLDDIIGKIMSREKFDYDLNGDALYQQYKNNYVQQGKMAMMDTMGQAAALTGGYGNSYAQSVGQQAYHGYLQKLNDVVPELYQLAMDKYRMEGDTLSDQYAILAQQEGLDYGRHRDQMADWHTERDYLSDRYDAERGYDYGLYRDSVADDQWEQSFGYQKERDKVADEQWQAEFDEAKRQYDQNYALQKSKRSGSSSGKTGVLTDDKKTAEIGSGAIAGAIVGAIPYAPSGKDADTTSVDNFLKTLPYANSGTTGDQWRDFVEMRLLEAVESGSLTEAELDMAVKRLGFKY